MATEKINENTNNNTDMLMSALLDELSQLNSHFSLNKSMSEIIKNNGMFLYGLNPAAKVPDDAYRKYVSFIFSISDILEDFGIPVKNNGYAYIVDAVMIIMDQNRLDIKLENDVYPYIRKKYGLNETNVVEHNIRNAIKSAFLKCKRDKVQNRMVKYEKKPTNKEFILMVTHEVCSAMCKDLLPPND